MKNIVLLILFAFSCCAYSQEPIETDRPDQTECASVVAPGLIQLETGVLYTNDRFDDIGGHYREQSYNYATSLLRIGVFKQAELRLEVGEYEKSLVEGPGLHAGVEGFSPFVIGTKIAVCEESGILPKTAFIGHLQLPFGDEQFIRKNEVVPSFCFTMAHTLSKRFSMGYNLGMDWTSGSAVPAYFYTWTVGAAATRHFEVFVETFGNFAHGELPESYFDIGGGYRVSDNFKLDCSGGISLNENSTDLFISVGFAVRIPR
jgi:hypothetical protein